MGDKGGRTLIVENSVKGVGNGNKMEKHPPPSILKKPVMNAIDPPPPACEKPILGDSKNVTLVKSIFKKCNRVIVNKTKTLKKKISWSDQFPPIQGCMPLIEVKMNYINAISNKIAQCPKITLKIEGRNRSILLDSVASSSVMDYSTLLGLGHTKKV